MLRNITAVVGMVCVGGAVLVSAGPKADEMSARARKLHFSSIVVDTHDDTTQRFLDGDFDLDSFEHFALYNDAEGRVEIYVRSLADQEAAIAGRRFAFAADELIHTEYSYKYAVPEFRALAARAGFRPVDTWIDPNELFSVHYFRLR